MKREDLFRAIGEAREDQILEAETVKQVTGSWKRAAALAACLALVVSAGAAGKWLGKEVQWQSLIGSFNPLDAPEEAAGGGADAGGTSAGGGLDGSDYSSDGMAVPSPNLSKGVEIGELQGPGDGRYMLQASACLVPMTEEEIFAQDRPVYRGVVQSLRYYVISGGYMDMYYTVAEVKVQSTIHGEARDAFTLVFPGADGYMNTSVSGALADLKEGSEAIFMPESSEGKCWEAGKDRVFYHADLGDLYLDEGIRHVFLDTGSGLELDRETYPALTEAESLDEVAAYIREVLGEDVQGGIIEDVEEEEAGGYVFVEGGKEQAQTAAVPAEPQAEPSKTEEAGVRSNAPGGAKELPGGALISNE